MNLSYCVDYIINLHDGDYRFGRQGDGAGRHQQRLNHGFFQNVSDGALPHVDAAVDLSLGMFVPQLGNGSNGIETSVFSQSVGNDLKGFGKCLETIGVGSDQSISMFAQFQKQFSF